MPRTTLLLALACLLIPALAAAQNQPPVVDAGEDQEIFVDQLTILEGSAWDPDGQPVVGWLWSVEEQPPGSSPFLTETNAPDPQFSGDVAGDYVLSLIATDGVDWSEPDFVTIHVVEILPPVAIATADVTCGLAPLTVHFDGSQSYDPQGGPLGYYWNFGDGESSVGVSPTHEYPFSGPFLASLTVTDSLGQLDIDTIPITVLDAARALPNALDSGRYTAAGFHDSHDTSYEALVGSTRSFFVFDLSCLPAARPILAATLLLDVGTVTQGTFGGISYTLYDVSTSVPTLLAGGSGLTEIYDDLGAGTALSAVTEIAPGDQGGVKPIPLLPAGLAALAAGRGGLLAMGGAPSGLGGNYAFRGTDVTGAQLVIELGPPPVPALPPAALGVLASLLLLAGIGALLPRRVGGR